MSTTRESAPGTGDPLDGGLSKKGLSAGTVGLIGAVVIGISCIAPAYTLTAALGPTVSEVGFQVPAIILIGSATSAAIAGLAAITSSLAAAISLPFLRLS